MYKHTMRAVLSAAILVAMAGSPTLADSIKLHDGVFATKHGTNEEGKELCAELVISGGGTEPVWKFGLCGGDLQPREGEVVGADLWFQPSLRIHVKSSSRNKISGTSYWEGKVAAQTLVLRRRQ